MNSLIFLSKEIKSGAYDKRLSEVYVDENLVAPQRERYVEAIAKFEELFPGYEQVEIYSAPGRSEVCGNHTDHQNGMVLATSINLDAIAIVAKREDGRISLVSDEMPREEIDIQDISKKEEEEGTTTSLIKGVLAGLKERGYVIGGFAAYITSDVLMGAGLSSSAAFESLIGTIVSGLYNEGRVSSIEIAQIGQYAENDYFGKPCGLMDQMACSVGGMVFIDFADKKKPIVEAVKSDFEGAKLSLCIVDTKGSHVDLTPDYAAVPQEMNAIAKAFQKECLREVPFEEFMQNIAKLHKEVGGRAVARALHFYGEEQRVQKAVTALKENNYKEFLAKLQESGDSSFKYLQNIYSPKQADAQNMTVALGVTQILIGENGVCRVHGGGFAGTILVFLKNECVAGYKEEIEKVFGKDSCHVLKVRPYGGIKIM